MHIAVSGISYKSADLSIREKWIAQYKNIPGTVLLITCNRCEIYSSGPLPENLNSHYCYYDFDCFFHLCLVASGLDSAELAETDIRRQIKQAYERASIHDLPSSLHFLFQKSLKVGKEVHSSLFSHHSLMKTEKLIAKYLLPYELLLFIGSSQINRKIIELLLDRGKKITLASRHLPNPFLKKRGISFIPMEEVDSWWRYEAIVAATHNRGYLIEPHPNPSTQIIIDLSVPRCANPKVGVVIFNMDQLNTRLLQHHHSYEKELERGKETIKKKCEQYMIRMNDCRISI